MQRRIINATHDVGEPQMHLQTASAYLMPGD